MLRRPRGTGSTRGWGRISEKVTIFSEICLTVPPAPRQSTRALSQRAHYTSRDACGVVLHVANADPSTRARGRYRKSGAVGRMTEGGARGRQEDELQGAGRRSDGSVVAARTGAALGELARMPLAAHHTPAPACPRVVAASRVEDSPWCARVFLRAAGSWTTPDTAPCNVTALGRSSRRSACCRSSTCSAAGAARLRGSTWSCTPGRVPRLPGLYVPWRRRTWRPPQSPVPSPRGEGPLGLGSVRAKTRRA